MLPAEYLLRKPHVVEVEHPLVFAENRRRPMADWFRIYGEQSEINRKIARPECRRVITFSKGLVEHAKQFVSNELWPKLTYAYPAFPTQPTYDRPTGRPFHILTIASRFSDKGVPEALKAFARLRARRHGDVVMTLVSQDVPPGYALPEGLTLHAVPRMDPELKRSLYQAADVLLLPCYSETAACFTEACAYGVPIVTTRIHHGDEFVEPGINGYLIEPPVYIYSPEYGKRWKTAEEFWIDLAAMRERGELEAVVDQIEARLSSMIENPATTARMRGGARAIHAEKFSPEVRNARLMSIYREALTAV